MISGHFSWPEQLKWHSLHYWRHSSCASSPANKEQNLHICLFWELMLSRNCLQRMKYSIWLSSRSPGLAKCSCTILFFPGRYSFWSWGFACGRQNRVPLNKGALNRKIYGMSLIIPVTSLFTLCPLSAMEVLSDFSTVKHLHSFSENNNKCQCMKSLFSQNSYCSASGPYCFSSPVSGLQSNPLYLQWKAKYVRARQLTISLQSITAYFCAC